jgi:hypothetical protein
LGEHGIRLRPSIIDDAINQSQQSGHGNSLEKVSAIFEIIKLISHDKNALRANIHGACRAFDESINDDIY